MIDVTHTIEPEWGNSNALRAYPLDDDAPAANIIPKWVMADMRISVSSNYAYAFISSVYVSDTLIGVTVSGVKQEGQNQVIDGLLSKIVTRDELEPFRAYSMDQINGKAAGSIVFGEPPKDLLNIHAVFTPNEARLIQSAVTIVRQPGVVALHDMDYGVTASGIIDLSGNSEFRTYRDPNDANTVVIELTDLYKNITTSSCDSYPSFTACGETPVKTINGVAPDATGKITLKFR